MIHRYSKGLSTSLLWWYFPLTCPLDSVNKKCTGIPTSSYGGTCACIQISWSICPAPQTSSLIIIIKVVTFSIAPPRCTRVVKITVVHLQRATFVALFLPSFCRAISLVLSWYIHPVIGLNYDDVNSCTWFIVHCLLDWLSWGINRGYRITWKANDWVSPWLSVVVSIMVQRPELLLSWWLLLQEECVTSRATTQMDLLLRHHIHSYFIRWQGEP